MLLYSFKHDGRSSNWPQRTAYLHSASTLAGPRSSMPRPPASWPASIVVQGPVMPGARHTPLWHSSPAGHAPEAHDTWQSP